MRRTLSPSAALSLLVGLAGCGGPPPQSPPIVVNEPARGDSPATTSNNDAKYPAGPYGYTEGEVIENLHFLGRADDNGNGVITDDPVREIKLSDFYQDKSIKAIAVLIAAEWCGPCQEEQYELVKSWSKYHDMKAGVVYVEALIESSDAKRSPADIGTVDRWSGHQWTNYADKKSPPVQIPFAVVADPTVELGPYYPYPAFPTQVLVNAADMTIVWRNSGYSPGALESWIDNILSGTN